MKTKVIIYKSISIAALLFLFLPSCKKRTETTLINTTDDAATQTIIAADELEVNYELDQTVNEAILASSISSTTSGIATSTNPDILFTAIPDAVIDTNKIKKGIIIINYYGKNPDKTKARTGTLEIRHALAGGKVIPWKTKGASMKLIYNQYEIVFLKIVNKSIVLNDTGVVTNLSGGLLQTLLPGDSVVNKVKARLAFTNNDNITVIQQWIWDFNRHQVYKLNDTTITTMITGDTVVNGTDGVVTCGTTRSGQNFYTSITTPVIQNIAKSSFLYNPLSGVKNIQGIKEPITVTYGVDQQGNLVNSGKPYGYKFKWINASGITKGELKGY